MKPRAILLYLLVIAFAALGLVFIFPKEGIKITDNWRLKFHWDISDVSEKEITYANISKIIEENQPLIGQDSIMEVPSDTHKINDTLRANASDFKGKIQPIEFPSGDKYILAPFFEKLNMSGQQRVRIFHFGDSQIEGDRITGYLRNQFQKRFGGSGPGLMPVVPANAETSSIIHNASSNWEKHAIYFDADSLLPHRKFGILGSFARFTHPTQVSLPNSTDAQQAYVQFSRSAMAYTSVNQFLQCEVFYGNSENPFLVRGFVNDSLVWFDEVEATLSTQSFVWNMEEPPKKFRIEFESTESPDIYGFALDAPIGVSVDNLPFRGSSGDEFTKLDSVQFLEMAKNLNPGLLIFEFGVNVVPYQVKNFSFYERLITRQLQFLKKNLPQTAILVIGVSDMSERKGNYFETYPSLQKVIMAQRNAAKNSGCAFWNLYEAMGGKNSMPSWVFAEPPLASPDFVHFNRRGGHIVAQMLFNAIMDHYSKYQSTNTMTLQ